MEKEVIILLENRLFVCQQTILMKYHNFFFFRKLEKILQNLPADDSHEYHALLVIFEKVTEFEIVICCKLLVVLYGLEKQISSHNSAQQM